MGKVMAIGGISSDRSKKFFIKKIVEMTGKFSPKGLFLPTARREEGIRDNSFLRYVFGCEMDALYVDWQDFEWPEETYSQSEIQDRILSADFIYVPGGDTIRLLKFWYLNRVDEYLNQAYENGTVLSGSSAGAICWFNKGHSDALSFDDSIKDWDYIMLPGLNILDYASCPHFGSYTSDQKLRKDSFFERMKSQTKIGFGIDDNAAIQFIDGEYEAISSDLDGYGKAYKVVNQNGNVVSEELITGKKYKL